VPSTGAPEATLQLSHPPAQAELQHTPSAQKPEVHWLAAVQPAPGSSRCVHAPWSQKRPASQSVSATQAPGQAGPAPEQVSGVQSPACPAASTVHVPSAVAPSDCAHAAQPPGHGVSQQTPSTQFPEAHWPWAVQVVPLELLAAQVPAVQAFPGLQSASSVQAVMQAALPLHSDRPHSVPGSVRAGRAVQRPTAPTRLHAWQVTLQALSQQVPSSQ
jgi:hypothetical protein